jgi:DNA topoisomerase-1
VSKRGKTFYGCSRFPECSFATWDKPVAAACPQCNAAFMVEKETKKEGKIYRCLNPVCNYSEPAS